MPARVQRVATFCTRVQRRVVCCTENSFPHHVGFTPHPTPARKIFKLRIAQRHLGAIGNPSPSLRGLELDYTSRATHICGASPPRSSRRALSRSSQLNGTKLSIRHVFALPRRSTETLGFIAELRHICTIQFKDWFDMASLSSDTLYERHLDRTKLGY